jgi:hypothetical protein
VASTLTTPLTTISGNIGTGGAPTNLPTQPVTPVVGHSKHHAKHKAPKKIVHVSSAHKHKPAGQSHKLGRIVTSKR